MPADQEHAETGKRRVSFSARIHAEGSVIPIEIVELYSAGLVARLVTNQSLPETIRISLDDAHNEVDARVLLHDKDQLELGFIHGHTSQDLLRIRYIQSHLVEPARKLNRLFASKTIATIFTLVSLVIIVWQTNEIRHQNRMQTILSIQDSERFINKILIEETPARQVLFSGPDEPTAGAIGKSPATEPDKALPKILTMIFIQEWEKMYEAKKEFSSKFRLVGEKILDDDYWNEYEKIIGVVARHPRLQAEFYDADNFTGFECEFINHLRCVANLPDIASRSMADTTIRCPVDPTTSPSCQASE